MTANDVAEHPGYLAVLRGRVWSALPALFVSGTLVCFSSGVVVVLAPGITPLALLLAAVLVGPTFASLVSQLNDLIVGRALSTFSVFRAIGSSWRLALALALPPAAAGTCFLIAAEIWSQTGSALALIPAAVSGCCAVLLAIASAAALPLALELPSLRGRLLIVTALHVVAKRPVPMLGVISLIVIGVWAAIQFALSLLFLLPVPLAAVLVAAVWTAAEARGLRPRDIDSADTES
jgi:hypothetical protein